MTNQNKLREEIIEIKRKLESAGFDDFDKIVFMPQIPVLGYPREYVIEEWFGIKVAKLISSVEN